MLLFVGGRGSCWCWRLGFCWHLLLWAFVGICRKLVGICWRWRFVVLALLVDFPWRVLLLVESVGVDVLLALVVAGFRWNVLGVRSSSESVGVGVLVNTAAIASVSIGRHCSW